MNRLGHYRFNEYLQNGGAQCSLPKKLKRFPRPASTSSPPLCAARPVSNLNRASASVVRQEDPEHVSGSATMGGVSTEWGFQTALDRNS
jgi:hypothetical protein